mgnify:CR=1 FL=1
MMRGTAILGLLFLAHGAMADSRSDESAFDARALEWLGRTVAAYAQVKTLEQKTEFISEIIPLDPPKPGENTVGRQEETLKQSLRLLAARPNRLRLETTEPDAFGRMQTAQTICDGKYFWTFHPEKNWYTKDKAPRGFADFAKLKTMSSGSLEMMMLMEINPFIEIKKTATAIRDEGDETLRNGEVHWVSIVMDAPTEQTVLRLAIGKGDGLLRRVVHERTPTTSGRTSQPIDDGLEALKNARRVTLPEEVNQPPQETAPLRMKSRLTYNNFFSTTPTFAFDAFAFAIPPTAFRYGDLPDKQKPKKTDFFNALKERAAALRGQGKKP